MNRTRATIREWLPMTLSVACLILTAIYATTKQGSAAEQIRRLDGLASSLSDASTLAQAGVMSPSEVGEQERKLQVLDQRMIESKEPGLVQAGLMDSARTCGLQVREVQPTGMGNRNQNGRAQDGVVAFPAYRVVVEGTYGKIAEYLESCRTQRLPARAIGFKLNPALDEKGAPLAVLRAEISMESFIPPPPPQEAADAK